MKTRLNALLMAPLAALVLPLAVLAQTTPAEGEVTKVDPPAARVTIKHRGVKTWTCPR